MALFWLISRPNSRAAFASALGIDPPRYEGKAMIVFDCYFIEFSDKRTGLTELVDLVGKLFDPTDSCLENRCERSNLCARDEEF